MCQSCKASTETEGLWPYFDTPKCLWCTARLIKRIGSLPIPAGEVAARRRVVLADACAYGHSEASIRSLVKTGPLVAPVEGRSKK